MMQRLCRKPFSNEYAPCECDRGITEVCPRRTVALQTSAQVVNREQPLHIRALLANGEVRLASDRIAKLLDNPEQRHKAQHHINDLKAYVEQLDTLIFRMALERAEETTLQQQTEVTP